MTTVDLASVFGDLADVPRWVAWRWEDRGGKRTKPLYSPVTGRYASHSRPEDWVTLDSATEYAAAAEMTGVGIVLGEVPELGVRLGGVDLDAARDPETGELTRWARKIIDGFQSYTEVSPSGTGVKILALGAPASTPCSEVAMDTPPIGGKAAEVGVYVRTRYFTVTGELLDGSPDEIRDAGEVGDAWDRMVRLLEQRGQRPGGNGASASVQVTGNTDLSPRLREVLGGEGKAGRVWKSGKGNGADRSTNDASLAGTLGAMGFSDAEIEAAIRNYPLGQVSQESGNRGYDADRQVERLLSRQAAPARESRENGSQPSGQTNGKERGSLELHTIDRETLEAIGDEKTMPIDAVPTPWDKWDRACRGAGGGQGLARGWHVVIGAASGSGKSLIAANMVAKAVRKGVDVCLFSLEMSEMENMTRILAIASNTSVRKLEHGAEFDRETWRRASEQFADLPGKLKTNDRPIHSMADIGSAMRRHAEEGYRMMVIDYLQLAWVGNADTLYQQITEVSHTVQMLAKDLGVTTVGLSQVNRRASTGDDPLQKEGLLGGSSLENDAEQVLLLGKQKPYAGSGYAAPIQIAKNRHGPKVTWRLCLNTDTLQLTQLDDAAT